MSTLTINTQYVNVIPTHNTGLAKGVVGTFDIISSLDNLGIDEDDSVIIASPTKEDLAFVSEGTIIKVFDVSKIPVSQKSIDEKKSQGLAIPKEKYNHKFQLEIVKDLSDNNLLSDLEYSIKAVYRFNKPIVHFQQQYRDLTKHDYETIVKGWVYATRTAFGKIANSIPRQNKLEFLLHAMDHFSTVDFKKISLLDGLIFLEEYIQKRILNRGKLLVETNNLIKANLAEIIPPAEVGFVNAKNSISDNLSTQAELFEKLFSLKKKSNIQQLIKKGISEDSQLEHRFLEIFKSETWPIDLSI